MEYRKNSRSFKAGEVIFEQGSESDAIYSITSGLVSVYKSRLGLLGKSHHELAKLGPGSIFGEMGVLGQHKREASLKALEDTEVLVITNEIFEEQMLMLPSWVVGYIKTLISRLHFTNQKLLEATGGPGSDPA